MIDLIKQVNELGGWNVFVCFCLVLCIIVTAITGYKKILSVLGLRTEKSIKEDQTNEKINNLQSQIDDIYHKLDSYQDEITNKQEQYHNQSIDIRNNLVKSQDELKENLLSLKEMLQDYMKIDNETTIAQFRSSLWRLHKDFTTQGFITPDGLKTFMEMGKVYERAGGDDIYHEKLLPEVEALEIHYPDGSIYNQNN